MFLRKIKFFFAHKKLKKPPSKVAQKNSNPLFFPLNTTSTAQMAQTEEFMFQNVTYRSTVDRAGILASLSNINKKLPKLDGQTFHVNRRCLDPEELVFQRTTGLLGPVLKTF
jgi:hypothetical protein